MAANLYQETAMAIKEHNNNDAYQAPDNHLISPLLPQQAPLDNIPIGYYSYPIRAHPGNPHREGSPGRGKGYGADNAPWRRVWALNAKARRRERRGGAGPRPLIVALRAIRSTDGGLEPHQLRRVRQSRRGCLASTLAPPRRSIPCALSERKEGAEGKREKGDAPALQTTGRRSVGFHSPHGAKRNAGTICSVRIQPPDCASLHPGYATPLSS